MSGYINKDMPSSSPKIRSYNTDMPSSSPKRSSGKTEVLSGKEQATMDLAKREFAKSVFTAGVKILRDFNSLSYCDLSPEFIEEFPDYISQFTSKSIEVFGAGTTLQLAAIYNLEEIAKTVLSSPVFLKEISADDLTEAYELATESGAEKINQLISQSSRFKGIKNEDLLAIVDLRALRASENKINSFHLDHLNLENSNERFPTMMLSNAFCLKKFGGKFFRELCIKFR